ncbi:MAG TPA: 3-hydroxyacyl-CoA dehydrogenase family protein [Syntrophales bacterium]|jgi:3-hydroxyacyl-CoA dehydrogenase|nr:3-hydroxyacyl-CoA dehydrogenase family protein [Syntrophales bacterium]
MKVSEIKRIGVLGGGIIGSSWSTYFLWKGFPVVIYDINDQALTLSRNRITANLSYLKDKEVLTEKAVTDALERVLFTTEISEAVENVQFVQEAGPENYAAKQALVAALDRYGSPDTVFASSTSGLLITEIAKSSKYPERCIGAHPYNPPHLIPLVEITKGDYTDDTTVQTAYDFYKKIGKEPIILKKEALGFISNRLQLALYREAIDLVLRGVCSVEDIDKAVCFGPGLRFAFMGPNLIFQLGGGKVGIKGLLEHVGPSIEMWWADMAEWKKWPEGSREILQEGVNQEMANRRPEEGRTTDEITLWRDDKLLKLLKLLNKL